MCDYQEGRLRPECRADRGARGVKYNMQVDDPMIYLEVNNDLQVNKIGVFILFFFYVIHLTMSNQVPPMGVQKVDFCSTRKYSVMYKHCVIQAGGSKSSKPTSTNLRHGNFTKL